MRASSEDLWLFGYGSLVWRPGFPYEERRPGHVRGFVRRFWQGSIDHRGVPGAPGRVVTLVRGGTAGVWGMAYRLRPETRQEVVRTLDRREQGGYSRSEVTVRLHGEEQAQVRALLYVARDDNPHYLGPAPLCEIAAQIQRASGPSGPNVDYLVRLADFLRSVGADEPHVFELERRVLRTGRGSNEHESPAGRPHPLCAGRLEGRGEPRSWEHSSGSRSARRSPTEARGASWSRDDVSSCSA